MVKHNFPIITICMFFYMENGYKE